MRTSADPLESFVEWAWHRVVPIEPDADIDAFDDLRALKPMIGDARVVGLGESQHHVAEFNRFRARLFRYLVTELNFTTFVFECGVIEAKSAYDYVLGAHDDADDAFTNIDWCFGLWRELQDLLRWMRDHNSRADTENTVHFYGMDGSHGWTCAGPTVVFSCDYLDRLDSNHAQEIRNELLPIAESVTLDNVHEAPAETLRELNSRLSALVGHFQIERIHYIERSSVEEFDWAHRAAVIARQIGTVLGEVHARPDDADRAWWNIRDACMATQLKWIREREGPKARLLVGAHNIHLQNGFGGEADFPQTTMGQHLAVDWPAADAVMIAGTNDHSLRPDDPAVDGSFQSALAGVGPPAFVLDLRPAIDEGPAALWLNTEHPDRTNTMYQPLSPGRAWDAVFFTQHVSLDRLSLPARLQRSCISLDRERLDGLVGDYDIAGVTDQPVVLHVMCEGDHLATTGIESDGELFPMHRSVLFALSDERFCWSEWPMELEFERDASGIARGLYIHSPVGHGKYHGARRA